MAIAHADAARLSTPDAREIFQDTLQIGGAHAFAAADVDEDDRVVALFFGARAAGVVAATRHDRLIVAVLGGRLPLGKIGRARRRPRGGRRRGWFSS